MSRSYAYISFMKNPRVSDESKADNVSLDVQRQKLEEHIKGFDYVYSEAHANTGEIRSSNTVSRPALDILINSLKSGDTVYIYSWFCLIIGSQMQRMSVDICNALSRIHDTGATVHFVKEQLNTGTAQGKLTITTIVAAAQYDYDVSSQAKVCNSNVQPACKVFSGC
jgi:DNA invertase Pin-like site-specific DNA recombinase